MDTISSHSRMVLSTERLIDLTNVCILAHSWQFLLILAIGWHRREAGGRLRAIDGIA